MGRFDDRLTHPLPKGRDLVRILREGGFRGKRPRDEGALVPKEPVPSLPVALAPGEASFTWIGHATYLVQMGGIRIATDPVWGAKLPGNLRRITAPALPLDVARPDVVTVSHNHYDHLDSWTFRRLPKATTVLAPLGTAQWFRKRGFADVHELDWWQSVEVRGVQATFVPAHHWSRRGPFDTNDTLWGGWMLEAGGLRAYHAGDTAYGPFFSQIRARLGAPDVAMLPIGAYEPRWFMQGVHMDPDEAVQAAQDLGARHLAAMHWGTFPLTREPILEPPARARTAWAAAGRNRRDLWDLPIGGTRTARLAAAVPVRGRRSKVVAAGVADAMVDAMADDMANGNARGLADGGTGRRQKEGKPPRRRVTARA